jgi:hypothetical protein
MASFIEFLKEVRPATRLTDTWTVQATNGVGLGKIVWYGAWRKYCFFPLGETVFDKACLRDIANFCEQQTETRK